MTDVAAKVRGYQIELFQLLGEFFGRATGSPAREFATIEGFGDKVRSEVQFIAHRSEDAFRWADTELRTFYAKKGIEIFGLARRLGGMKLVLGGSSRFQGSQLASVQGALLYADTVLIPDPVLPWLETERREEKFRHVLMLQAAHAILHLKPMVDADLAHCPVLVFPSFEKSLEEVDAQTLHGTVQLVADVCANFINSNIANSTDLGTFVREQPDAFLAGVEQHKLFVAGGGPIGEAVQPALKRYDADVQTWRSAEWLREFAQLTPAAKVLNAITERLQPQYHLLENAEELGAHPLLSVKQQGHYFNIVSQMNSERLERVGLLDKKTKAMLAGVSSPRLSFLSNISIEHLVEVRRSNDNEAFRKLLTGAVGNLHDSALEDIDRVAAELCGDIESGVASYNRTLRDIDDKFKSKNRQTFTAGALMATAFMWPSLAPFIGAGLPIAIATKYGLDAWDKYDEKRKASRSLMGLLAVAKDAEQKI